MRSCENAIGIMTKLQTSLVAEETWVDGATERISVLPTATSALELDVSQPTKQHKFVLNLTLYTQQQQQQPPPIHTHYLSLRHTWVCV